MRDIYICITAASYSGNKGAAAMLQSSIRQLYERYEERLNIQLMSVYPSEDREQVPWDFVKVVSCKPEELLFIAFPLAVLYRLFQWCPLMKKLVLRHKILKAYARTDLVIDEAGISFVDSRGFVMNTYAFVCAAVPMLLGVPVVKYSQAMGSFHNPYNRFLAKWILPKMKLICARGKITRENLASIGVTENVVLCADGAFTMEDTCESEREVSNICDEDVFYSGENVVGLSLSSVVEKRCNKTGIDYKTIMIDFIEYLNQRGYRVLLIANGARINSEKSRNNDLMICDAVYDGIRDKSMVRWYHEEMDAEKIRALIGKCRFLVASRFHAMIGALQKEVPVLLIGWSHKYQEVLDFFELGQYAIDYSVLSVDQLKLEFERFEQSENEIRSKIRQNYDGVMKSSADNIRLIADKLDELLDEKEKCRKKGSILEFDNPEKYMGSYLALRKGYAAEKEIRQNAASGGMVTAFLCFLLRKGYIDGAWVTKSCIRNGELDYDTYIAVTEEQIREASSSIYMEMPLLKHIDMVRQFEGRIAVVLTPCMLRGLRAMMERDEELKKKIVITLGLFCSGEHGKEATLIPLKKYGLSLDGAKRLYYRRGKWRGLSSLLYEDDSEKVFSYTKSICAYKNAYFFEKGSCMYCQDQYANAADISFGDIWNAEMKKETYKHTGCVIRSPRALQWYREAVTEHAIVDSHISGKDMIRGQKRALVFKYTCAPAKNKNLKKELEYSEAKCGWNHKLAFRLAMKNKKFSEEHSEVLERIPMPVIYYYMCMIRVLLSF